LVTVINEKYTKNTNDTAKKKRHNPFVIFSVSHLRWSTADGGTAEKK
jgi:hypothetical protein